MITQFATKLFRTVRPAFFLPRYNFANGKDLKNILKTLKVELDGKSTGLEESGIIVGQHFDPSTDKVTISLNLNKDYRRIKALLKDRLTAEGFQNIDITLAPKSKEDKYQRKGNLQAIKKIVAVSSCKGGVGKSTIAINIAATLQRQGNTVGIFDSDIYGPSLPTLIGKETESLRPYEGNEKEIEPIDYEGLRCMSFGFVGQKSAVMRGPIVSSIVSQLLHQTHWG